MTSRQLERYGYLRRLGHGALRAYRAAIATIGESMRARHAARTIGGGR